jgi:hypothetical protein
MTLQFSASIVCVVLRAGAEPALARDINLGNAAKRLGPRDTAAFDRETQILCNRGAGL